MKPTYLLKNLILFGRVLRAMGLDVGPGQVIDLAAALEYIDIGNRDDFYHAARALVVHRRADLPLFDQAFKLFWRARTAKPVETELEPNPELQPRSLRIPNATLREIPLEDEAVKHARPSERVMVDVQQTFSAMEVLRHKNFEAFTWEEVQQAKQWMAQMTWRVGERRTRRKRSVLHGDHLDLRRIVRRNLKYGSEFIDLAWKDVQFKPRPLVVLCDISGSMERYSRLLLHFLHALTNGMEHVEAFLFGTRLTRITRQIKRRDIDEAMDGVVKVVTDWGGGTRIGEALKTFNYRWARRVAARGAVVLLISDGWDRGDPAVLAQEIARLQRNCFRLIWLNPLIASPGFEPLTQGLRAALPYVDDFLPVHNLASLEALARALSELNDTRPPRRQVRPETRHGIAAGRDG